METTNMPNMPVAPAATHPHTQAESVAQRAEAYAASHRSTSRNGADVALHLRALHTAILPALAEVEALENAAKVAALKDF